MRSSAALAALLIAGCGREDPAPVAKVAAIDPRPCDAGLSALVETGLIKDRPASNRVDVEEVNWAAMPAKQKRTVAAAVRCSFLRGDIGRTDFDSFAVVYGYRSGKRLAMASHNGVSLE